MLHVHFACFSILLMHTNIVCYLSNQRTFLVDNSYFSHWVILLVIQVNSELNFYGDCTVVVLSRSQDDHAADLSPPIPFLFPFYRYML